MNYNVDSLINLITETVREILNKSHIIPITELQNAANKSAAASSSSKNQSSENTVIMQLLNKKVIVEQDIKTALQKNVECIEIMKTAIITPAAVDFAKSKKIKLIKK